jgi:DnaJ-class molecular chaperone
MKPDLTEDAQDSVKSTTDVAAERVCLRCRTRFWSEGFGERICTRCKGTVSWRMSVPSSGGFGRARGGGSN